MVGNDPSPPKTCDIFCSSRLPAPTPPCYLFCFRFSGNNYLCVQYEEGKCIQEIRENRNNSKTVILGISISGCLVFVLALMLGVAVYWKKLMEKRRFNEGLEVT